MTLFLKQKALEFTNNFMVALDGPSASGKGLIGRMLAEQFKLEYFQSSLVYRGLAHLCITQDTDIHDTLEVIKLSTFPQIIEYAKTHDLSDENIGSVASQISTIKEVRKNLSSHLIELVRTSLRLIMEGRDIGTVIAPSADLKIFLTANIECRAERRYKQLKEAGKECIMPEILEQLKERDARDEARAHAPLVPARDALIIDTSNLLPTQIIEKIKDFIETR